MKPTVGSLFSGIGGFDLGLERAGWTVRWQVENNPYRRRVLKRHWPQVELRNDIRTDTDGLERVDLICGGFPCQNISVAGNRKGLAGERSALWHELARIVARTRPSWVLVENVLGLLSSRKGEDFATVIGNLAERGYGVAWRVLDSQNFGVPQRRRRVYIVGHLGAPCPPEVLFEPESLRGGTAAGRKTGAEIAGTLGGGAGESGYSLDFDRTGAFIPEWSRALTGKSGDRYDGDTETFVPERAHPLVGGGNDRHDESQETYLVNARQDPIVGKQPLDRNKHSLAVAIRTAQTGSNGWGVGTDGKEYTLDESQGQAVVQRVAGTVTGAEAHNGNSTPIPANYIAQPLRANRWGGSDSHGDEGNIVAQTLLGQGGHDGSSDPDPHSLVYGPSNYAGGRNWHELQRARAVNPSSATNGGSSGIVVGPTPDADRVRKTPGFSGRLHSDFDDEVARDTAEYWERELTGPDGPRYAALGDAVTVPVAEWIGRRILRAHEKEEKS